MSALLRSERAEALEVRGFLALHSSSAPDCALITRIGLLDTRQTAGAAGRGKRGWQQRETASYRRLVGVHSIAGIKKAGAAAEGSLS